MTAHVAFAIDAAYVPWCGVAMRSVVQHLTGPAVVHLLHDGDLDGRDVGRLADMAGGHLVEHRVDPGVLARAPAAGRFGRTVWLRVLLPDLLADVDRVLYLDADTLVVDDLAPLLASDLGGRAAGAVTNVVEDDQRPRLAALGLDPGHVLNSGVLLLDLDRWRRDDLGAAVLDLAAERGRDLSWPDQDALNLVLRDRWAPLHPRWNVQNSFRDWRRLAVEVHGARLDEALAEPAVVHFEGPSVCKPWHVAHAGPWRREWRAALADTPWAGVPLEGDRRLGRVTSVLPPARRAGAYVRLERTVDGARRRLASRAAREASSPPFTSTVAPEHRRILDEIHGLTMVSAERVVATIDAVEHVVRAGVPGAIVECGVWRGGVVLAMIRALQGLGVDDRDIWVYDTFGGMTAPSEMDTSGFDEPALVTWRRAAAVGERAWSWLFPADEPAEDRVRSLLAASGYPADRVHVVVGDVHDTLPQQAPDEVAVLRLDTDWYASTRHELESLWPRMPAGAVLLVDDYGHWDGCRRAVDEFLGGLPGGPPLLARTDYAGRLAVKPASP